jgi:hypothetical protein
METTHHYVRGVAVDALEALAGAPGIRAAVASVLAGIYIHTRTRTRARAHTHTHTHTHGIRAAVACVSVLAGMEKIEKEVQEEEERRTTSFFVSIFILL